MDKLKVVSLYPGNRLNAMIAIFNAYYFNNHSLIDNVELRKNSVYGVKRIFDYTNENQSELDDLEYKSFDYNALFDLWASLINIPDGFDILAQYYLPTSFPNKLGILLYPRIGNHLIKRGYVFFNDKKEIDESTILEIEKIVINKIWNILQVKIS